MSPAAISELVAEGHRLHQNITRDEELLKAVEKKLKKAALEGDQIDLVDEELEGKQFLAVSEPTEENPRKVTVPVIITSDVLAKSFAEGSETHREVVGRADGKLSSFFRRVTGYASLYEDGKAMRKAAAEILGDQAPAFITALVQRDKSGIAKNQIKVDWSRATVKEVA